jgi:hypothetical protein
MAPAADGKNISRLIKGDPKRERYAFELVQREKSYPTFAQA